MTTPTSNTPPWARFWIGELPDLLIPGRRWKALIVHVGRWRLEIKRGL